MGANSYYYLKLYYDMLDDPKVGRLPDHLFRRWVNLLLLAGEHDDDGYLPDLDTICWRLRPCDIDTLEGDLSQLEHIGLLDMREHPEQPMTWCITNFAKRQQRTSSAERQRQYRARKRKEAKEKEKNKNKDIDVDIDERYVTPVTIRNANVTLPEVSSNGGDFSDNLPDLEPEHRRRIKQVKSLVNSWKGLTGARIPADEDKRKEDYTDPAIAILKRHDWNVSSAFEAVKGKRQQMLGEGKTPFRLAAVVPYLIADGDAVGITSTGKQWWET